ncbi:MAG: hypothetical protein UU10_C0041G0014 [Parcubacteria group bacterium GW2011_GWF1_40_6]|nr:MAG: hypothetical protein UU10_C0041G0014 [Parcubacteria group bacterium GW2011_GWF1_40_6]
MSLYDVASMESIVRARLQTPAQANMDSVTILAALNDGYRDVASRAFCIEHEDTAYAVEGNRLVPFIGHRVTFVEYVVVGG